MRCSRVLWFVLLLFCVCAHVDGRLSLRRRSKHQGDDRTATTFLKAAAEQAKKFTQTSDKKSPEEAKFEQDTGQGEKVPNFYVNGIWKDSKRKNGSPVLDSKQVPVMLARRAELSAMLEGLKKNEAFKKQATAQQATGLVLVHAGMKQGKWILTITAPNPKTIVDTLQLPKDWTVSSQQKTIKLIDKDRFNVGQAGTELLGIETTRKNEMHGATLGVCLQRKIGLWKREDSLITTWHGNILPNEEVGKFLTVNGQTQPHMIGKVVDSVHIQANRIPGATDWDRVVLDTRLTAIYKCTCHGLISPRPVYEDVQTFVATEIAMGGLGEFTWHGARTDVDQTGIISDEYKVYTGSMVNGVLYPMIHLRAQYDVKNGDSGAGLFYQGNLVGILKGTAEGDERDTFFTPIWSVNIPDNYWMC